ncbi:MAG: carboxypeptidase-like regulatory domain-containing protein [Candidatus Thermoplasmatota archaeon]|nr:carboxypeptidase-like regulatory domain-containing protein [Candidatus Thermoplasmatota archaeon]MEE3315892.1 carboxypeptidase-like regulatory domain-containing protein [Candidatus Thermoplasmatota archaeon]
MTESGGDEIEDYSAMELWLHDLSVDPATRLAGGLMIFVGSLLGLLLGIALISANVGEMLTGQLDGSDGVADVNGIVSTALQDSDTGGEPAEGVSVSIIDSEGLVMGLDETDSGGRFSVEDIPRRTSTLLVEHPGNRTVQITLVPGDHAQISVTLTPGDGVDEFDMSGESHLAESVLIGSIIAAITLLAGLAGMVGGLEAYRGDRYRKTWWLAFFGLWSRGMLFVGPLLILIGMGMVNLSKDQFTDYTGD